MAERRFGDAASIDGSWVCGDGRMGLAADG
jgi:hypothetical protein